MTFPADFNSPGRIVKTAMWEAKLLAKGQEPSSQDYASYMPRLNDMANRWQTRGLKLWLNYVLPVPIVAGQALYEIGPGGDVAMTKPLRAIQGFFEYTAGGVRRPLTVLSKDEYYRLSTVVQQGAINSYYVDKQQTTLNVYFWLTPDAQAVLDGVPNVIIQQQVTNVIQLNDTMNFPVEWFNALYWGLADEICGGQPQAIMDRCEKKAKETLEDLENWDVEDASTMFQPDPQRAYTSGSVFRG